MITINMTVLSVILRMQLDMYNGLYDGMRYQEKSVILAAGIT